MSHFIRRSVLFMTLIFLIFTMSSCDPEPVGEGAIEKDLLSVKAIAESDLTAEEEIILFSKIKGKSGNVTVGGMGSQPISFSGDGKKIICNIMLVEVTFNFVGCSPDLKRHYYVNNLRKTGDSDVWDYAGLEVSNDTTGRFYLSTGAMTGKPSAIKKVFVGKDNGGLGAYPYSIK